MISVTTEKPFYYSGDIMRVNVRLELKSATKARRLTLGFGRHETVSHKLGDTVYYADHFDIMFTSTLWQAKPYQNDYVDSIVLEPGIYDFHVEIPLPEKTPSSIEFMEFSMAYLRYEINVLFERAGFLKFDKTTRLPIEILMNAPTVPMPAYVENFEAKREKPMKKYKLSWNLPDIVFDTTDTIQFQMKLENLSPNSKDEIKKVSVYLKERHALGDDQLTQIYQSTTQTIFCQGFGQNQMRHFVFQLKSDRSKIQPTAHGRFMHCDHSIRIVVHRKGLFRFNVNYEVPIIMAKMKPVDLPAYSMYEE
jgi:hypothetical protein